jgi:hypothetical protein
VSKFILNLHVEILKVLPNSEIYLNLKIKTLLIFPVEISPARPGRRTSPLLSGLLPSSPSPAGLRATPVPRLVSASIAGKRPCLKPPLPLSTPS